MVNVMPMYRCTFSFTILCHLLLFMGLQAHDFTAYSVLRAIKYNEVLTRKASLNYCSKAVIKSLMVSITCQMSSLQIYLYWSLLQPSLRHGHTVSCFAVVIYIPIQDLCLQHQPLASTALCQIHLVL